MINFSINNKKYTVGQPQKTRKLFACLPLILTIILCGCANEDPEPIQNVDEETEITSNRAQLFDGNFNMLSGGIISIEHTDSPVGFGINNIVDNNSNTFFSTPYSNFYILWNGSRNVNVTCYTLTSGDDRSFDPKSWTLSASNNNSTWTILDKQTEQEFTSNSEKKEYFFINKATYKYYKLLVENNNGGKSTQIAEWTLQTKADPNLPCQAIVTDENVNMPSGGILTAQYSDAPSGCVLLNLVDAKSNTCFSTYHNSFYILWQGNKNLSVNYYAITSATDNSAADPKSWTFSASNDSISWLILDEQVNQKFEEREQKKEYFFDNKSVYKYYKLVISDNNGADYTQIAEWTIRGLPSDIDNLMGYSNGRTLSTQTPMGKRFENRHVTTDSDRLWLSTASNEPALLASASSLTQLRDFPVTLYPYGTPMPADVNQHAIGDCCAMAVFASFAYLYPDFVKDIITDNGNKTYTVAMFDPQGKPVDVCVTSKFLADKNGKIGAVTGKSDKATWSTVLEKAMMKWQNIYKVNEDIGGIGTEHVSPLFTGDGDSFAFSANKLNAEQLYRAVGVSLNQGKLVIGGFTKGDILVSGNHKTVSGHAFTLMYSLDKTALFSMRNPWGGEDDGVYNIPDNGVIPPLIDLRIVNPGKAANYTKGIPTPYNPPYLAPAQRIIRVSNELLQSGR